MRPISLIMAIFLVFLYFSGISTFSMMEPDEGRYNSIPSEMLETGDFIAPKLNSVPYLVKPPLHHWLTCISFSIFGVNHIAGRVFPMLFTLLTALLLFLFLRNMVSERAGYFAFIIYLSAFYTIGLYGINILDQGVAFFITLALVMAFYFIKTEKPVFLYAVWIACALGILEKGLIVSFYLSELFLLTRYGRESSFSSQNS